MEAKVDEIQEYRRSWKEKYMRSGTDGVHGSKSRRNLEISDFMEGKVEEIWKSRNSWKEK